MTSALRKFFIQPLAHPEEMKFKHIFGAAWRLSAHYRWLWLLGAVLYFLSVNALPIWLAHVPEHPPLFFQSLLSNAPPLPAWWKTTLPYLSVIFVQLPLTAGLWGMAVKRAEGKPIHFANLFDFFRFNYWTKCVAMMLWAILIFAIPVIGILYILQGELLHYATFKLLYGFAWALLIYWLIAYLFTLPIMGVQPLKAGPAMSLSRRVVTNCWFKLFLMLAIPYILLFILKGLIIWGLFVSIMPPVPYLQYVGIGLLAACALVAWYLVPWFCCILGVLYRVLFGASSTAVER